MAIFHCEVKPISRGSGRSAVASAAYRSAEIVKDQKTGQTYDYTKKTNVIETAIFTPDNQKISRQELWNLAANSENRKDAREAREFELALPKEIPQNEAKNLAYSFAKTLVKRFQVAADICIHSAGAGSKENLHAHVMVTTRKMVGNNLTEKTDLELDDKKLKERGLPVGREQIKLIRKIWADLCNERLLAHNITPISHLSLKAQGVDRKPQIHLGPHASAMERRGIQTDKGNKNREIEPELSPEIKQDLEELKKLKMIQGGIENARAEKIKAATEEQQEQEQQEPDIKTKLELWKKERQAEREREVEREAEEQRHRHGLSL